MSMHLKEATQVQPHRKLLEASTLVLAKVQRALTHSGADRRIAISAAEDNVARRLKNISKAVKKGGGVEAVRVLNKLVDRLLSDRSAVRTMDGFYITGEEGDLGLLVPNGSQGRYSALAALQAISACAEEAQSPGKSDYISLLGDIPSQRPGPAHFEVRGGVVEVAKRVSPTLEEAEQIALHAREALTKAGAEILEEIRLTNCDRRLVSVFEQLQNLLINDGNSIAIGTWNLLAQTVTVAAKDELPSVVIALIEGHVAGVSMFVAQHADWQTFSENAMSCAFEERQRVALRDSIKEIERDFAKQPELAKSEVPATFRALADLVADPAMASKRALFAGVRSIENLFAAIFRSACEFLTMTSKQAISQGAGLAANVAVASLAMLAIGWATHSAALIAAIPEAVWIVTAAKLLGPALKELSKSTSK